MLVGVPVVRVHPEYDAHAGAAAQEFPTGGVLQSIPVNPPVQVYLQFGPICVQG